MYCSALPGDNQSSQRPSSWKKSNPFGGEVNVLNPMRAVRPDAALPTAPGYDMDANPLFANRRRKLSIVDMHSKAEPERWVPNACMYTGEACAKRTGAAASLEHSRCEPYRALSLW